MVGVTEKKTHSSSLEDHEADKVRAHFRSTSEASVSSKAARPSRFEPDEIKTKIDLSNISKPGDVLKAIITSSSLRLLHHRLRHLALRRLRLQLRLSPLLPRRLLRRRRHQVRFRNLR